MGIGRAETGEGREGDAVLEGVGAEGKGGEEVVFGGCHRGGLRTLDGNGNGNGDLGCRSWVMSNSMQSLIILFCCLDLYRWARRGSYIRPSLLPRYPHYRFIGDYTIPDA